MLILRFKVALNTVGLIRFVGTFENKHEINKKPVVPFSPLQAEKANARDPPCPFLLNLQLLFPSLHYQEVGERQQSPSHLQHQKVYGDKKRLVENTEKEFTSKRNHLKVEEVIALEECVSRHTIVGQSAKEKVNVVEKFEARALCVFYNERNRSRVDAQHQEAQHNAVLELGLKVRLKKRSKKKI